jgi:hypothetical protein
VQLSQLYRLHTHVQLNKSVFGESQRFTVP